MFALRAIAGCRRSGNARGASIDVRSLRMAEVRRHPAANSSTASTTRWGEVAVGRRSDGELTALADRKRTRAFSFERTLACSPGRAGS